MVREAEAPTAELDAPIGGATGAEDAGAGDAGDGDANDVASAQASEEADDLLAGDADGSAGTEPASDTTADPVMAWGEAVIDFGDVEATTE